MADKKSLARINSASNISKTDRQSEDFYATPSRMVELLIKHCPEILKTEVIWEPCNGMGHISKVVEDLGDPNCTVLKSDILDRTGDNHIFDFLAFDPNKKEMIPEWLERHTEYYLDEGICIDANIITNPPYNKGTEFYGHVCEVLAPGQIAAMFVKIQFLETQKRYEFFKKFPPYKVLVCVNRVHCGKDGHFDNELCSGGAACYCWLIYKKGYQGDCTLGWINTEDEIKEYQTRGE